jgi:hypothetical protein
MAWCLVKKAQAFVSVTDQGDRQTDSSRYDTCICGAATETLRIKLLSSYNNISSNGYIILHFTEKREHTSIYWMLKTRYLGIETLFCELWTILVKWKSAFIFWNFVLSSCRVTMTIIKQRNVKWKSLIKVSHLSIIHCPTLNGTKVAPTSQVCKAAILVPKMRCVSKCQLTKSFGYVCGWTRWKTDNSQLRFHRKWISRWISNSLNPYVVSLLK